MEITDLKIALLRDFFWKVLDKYGTKGGGKGTGVVAFPFYTPLGLFLFNDMQSPSHSKVAKLGFWFKKLRIVLKRMKNQFSDV